MPVPWSRVLWGSLSLALCVSGSPGLGGVVSSAVLGPLPPCLSASVLSSVLGVTAVFPSPSGVRAVASVWWPMLWPASSPGG